MAINTNQINIDNDDDNPTISSPTTLSFSNQTLIDSTNDELMNIKKSTPKILNNNNNNNVIGNCSTIEKSKKLMVSYHYFLWNKKICFISLLVFIPVIFLWHDKIHHYQMLYVLTKTNQNVFV